MSDKDFYKNAMDKIALHTMEEIDTKQIRQKKKNMHARHRKMAAAVALVILITGGTVYAAKIGIFDAIFQNTKQLYNQQETEVILTTEEEHIYAVDEDGNYMILNDDGTPFDIKAAYTEARDKGYIYPYQICLDEEDYHTYERTGIFDEEDLKNSIFNDDYTEITIDGETYHLEKSYMQKEDEPKDQCVLWAFPMSNWEQRAEIFARETMLWTKKDLKFFIFKFSFINLRHHIARANSVCLDTVTTPFKGHGLRQIDHTGLGGTVERKCACAF